MNDAESSANDSMAQRQRVLDFFDAEWPPKDAHELYEWGWSKLLHLGKEACLRAVLASYDARGLRAQETEYDRSARTAAERWVVNPSEETRKAAGLIASVQLPQWCYARLLANMAGRRKGWRTAVGFGLTGNPFNVSTDEFHVICAAVHSELLTWARCERDPVAERLEPL